MATLSGGETFMAALSLALGLAEVVQAHAGGIRLETVFVDEGFGSLDDESLDLAVASLMSLKEGGRLVGIISHVGELQGAHRRAPRGDRRARAAARRGSSFPDGRGGITGGTMHTGAMDRRTKALVMLIVAILAVIAFGTGITLCIDWGGASSPPRDYGQPRAAIALPVVPHSAAPDVVTREDPGMPAARRGPPCAQIRVSA